MMIDLHDKGAYERITNDSLRAVAGPGVDDAPPIDVRPHRRETAPDDGRLVPHQQPQRGLVLRLRQFLLDRLSVEPGRP